MTALNRKLQVTINQWERILKKEMAISEGLRNQGTVDQAKMMIRKIEGMRD